MNPPNYSEEQMTDIKAREQLCLDFLREHQMNPSAALIPSNVGDDVFGLRLIPYLADLKYNLTPSPLTKEDLK